MGQIFKTIFLTLYITFNIGVLSAQNEIVVQGVVVSANSGKPIQNIAILCDFIIKGRSDVDGRFSFVVARDAQLTFMSDQGMDYKDTTINVDGRNNIKVQMQSMAQDIAAVTVVAKIKRKPLSVEPTDLEVRGNYFHITPKLYIPYNAVTSDYRYVMQPTLVDVTTSRKRHFRPLVIDGKKYNLVMHRNLNFGETVDTLEQFIVPNTITPDNEVYAYSDSLYVDSKDLSNDFKITCEFVLVSYNRHLKSKQDSIKMFEIAKGSVNPLRFFDYSVSPMQLDETLIDDSKEPYLVPTGADTTYIPIPELDTHGSKGSAKIEFEVGRTKLDLNLASNRESIDKIRATLRDIQSNPYATLESIKVVGYASPEGGYEANLKLANLRTKEFLSIITSDIAPYNLPRIKLESKGVVETWDSVIPLAEKDNPELAQKISTIIDKYNGEFPATQWVVSRLPEYRQIIATRYLPQLRRMTYEINYSLLRSLTYQEVSDKYEKHGSDSLSRYEYYTLIVGDRDTLRREAIIRKALHKYPNFTIMANYGAIKTLRSDSVNIDLLKPLFEGKNTPIAVRYNQAAMALKNRDFAVADSLSLDLPLNRSTEHLHHIIALLNGDYDEAHEYFLQRGGLNEVLILLATKENEAAREKMTEMMKDYENGSNAMCHYVAAICANRMDDLSMATMHLNIALQIDPSLAEIAKMDGDIHDIYKLIELQNGGSYSESE